jgi:hypothetical protein
VLLAGAVAAFTWQLFTATKKSADAALLSAQAVINAERAHLYVIIKQHNVSKLIHDIRLMYSSGVANNRIEMPTLTYVLKNYGKTPAMVESIAHCVTIQETEGGQRTLQDAERALQILGDGEQTQPMRVAFEERAFIVEDAELLADNATMVFFYSEATFMDAFNRRYQIAFDFIYDAGSFHLISRRETI